MRSSARDESAEAPLSAVLPSPAEAGTELMQLVQELFPLCRSLTGDGVRETLRIIGRVLPLELTEIPTGTQIYDWVVPEEWNVRDAWILDAAGRRIVDFADSNLHLLGYSTPVETTLTGRELQEHLHSLPESPDWIPLRTSYYERTWGFCVRHRDREAIRDDERYTVRIDSALTRGSLTLGECTITGELEQQVLISTYVCHPSTCNDNLSGIAVAAFLGKHLAERRTRYTYRFLFAPSTLGALAWLSRNEGDLDRIRHGLVVSCVGDPGDFTYKRSRRGTATIDRAAEHILRHRPGQTRVLDFVPWGGDERQFCAPAFDLPVGSLTRTPHGAYPEYHTSADNLDFIRGESLAESLAVIAEVVDVLERDAVCLNIASHGEPQLGRRGLYRSLGSGIIRDREQATRALLWTLNLSDGAHSLLEIAERSGMPFDTIRAAADTLLEHGLLHDSTD